MGESLTRRRAVRRFLGLAAFLGLITAVASIPGIILLNQEYGWLPVRSGIFDIEVNGRSVSNTTVIRYSIGASLMLLVATGLLFVRALRNWRFNGRLKKSTAASTE